MAFCRLVIPLLVLSVVSATNVPVFLWGDLPKTSLRSNPLKTITAEEFSGILKNIGENDSPIVVFVEKTLSPEDFSLKHDGETSLPYLRIVENSKYLPSVENPVEVLRQLSVGDSKITFITLEDEGSRFDSLRRHNDFIAEQFAKLQKKNENIIGVYTGSLPNWEIPVTHSRVRRQANMTVSPDFMMDGLRLYVKSITLSADKEKTNVTGFVNSETAFNDTVMSTTMNFDGISLTLNFRSAGGYWFFDEVVMNQTTPSVNEVLYPTSDVEAFLGFSYRCKQFVSFSGVNNTKDYTITFEDIKVQPFFETSNGTTIPFGDSLNCVGFFSAPIWASLFVVFILLAITFYGIMMMMDIRTMDKFDDPKGKTITINAGE